ncbi:N-acylglucosamine-6-phosphate 2-epimerase [Microbacterium sp. W4I4]|uniref:N-acetylmannosamine-6-phosphate 2-epimerase n=1 Tax=Microbacterium sp. W4I4 TaxID=3042295 RepID=UPI00277F7B28|nr:N-acetylmannosamine-6-phosphate 2-epimerase [Microbacterium sp. W4I4]MDQ0614480.1 N-acylglucosamine-6-phosphate 2-epimerase [Microbacterium sp. W4I4]
MTDEEESPAQATVRQTLDRLRGRLIVSCQAYPGEAMSGSGTMVLMAQAVVVGGAAGVRLQGIADIRAGAAALDVPIIGLLKQGQDEVFITPTLGAALAVAEAGADIVAIDGTRRRRPDGLSLAETVAGLRSASGALIMADCGSLDDALAAEQAGVDILGTTLAGYTGERPTTPGPDLELVALLAAECELPVIAEGRIRSPADAAAAIAAGAWSVCVGTAITHPSTITSGFVQALDERSSPG